VHAAQPVYADNSIKFIEGLLDIGALAQIVTRCKGVSRIEANAHASFILNQLNQAGEVFKPVAEIAPLTSGVFDHRCHPFCFFE